MFQDRNHRRGRWKLLLSVALASIALFAAVAGTTAWLAADRSLTTLTKIDFVTLTLEGQATDSEPVNLSTLEVGKSKEMPFRIVTKKNAQYQLQLAHTTNLPLTYEIYTASEWAQKSNTLVKAANAPEAPHHDQTYSTGDRKMPSHSIGCPTPARRMPAPALTIMCWWSIGKAARPQKA